MNLFGLGKAPEWSPFKNAGEHGRFVGALNLAIEKGRLPLQESDEAGVLVSTINPEHRFGLLNLAQQCALLDRRQWGEVIDKHLAGVLAASAVSEELLDMSFEEARLNLKIRLYPVDLPLVEESVAYPSPEGIVTLLALDLPGKVITVRRDMAERWLITDEELYAIALGNVWDEGRLTFEPHHVETATLRIASGDSFFTASHALMLDRYTLDEPPLGILVSIPTRHIVAYHEIAEEGLSYAVQAMTQSGAGLFSEGPGSISPHLYWLHQGNWRSLSRTDDDRIFFEPPAEFIEVVAKPLGLE